MTSILNLEPWAPTEPKPAGVAGHDPDPEPTAESGEYEIVLGRAQIVCWLFLGVIAVAGCSSLAYLGGETIAAQKASHPVPAPASTPAALASLAPSKADLGSISKASAKAAQPIFAEPEIGKVYLQIGAVQRGMAGVLAEGLRGHGLDSFAAPGPGDNIFRVLIGPLPDPQAFREAMVAADNLDLTLFARKYQK